VTVAALYDVHGNVRALEAVLADGAADADVIVFGGDLVAGPWPRESLELAQSLGERARFVRGNWERAFREEPDHPLVAWLRAQVGDAPGDWQSTVTVDGVLYCHATPRRDDEIVLPHWDGSDWSSFTGPLVVCGHTHVQFDIERDGTRIVNPGSVGNPTIRSTAWWALVGDEVELRTTDYDTVAASEEMRSSAFPQSRFADELLEPYSLERILETLA
jgi:predicted phosphodiesterase